LKKLKPEDKPQRTLLLTLMTELKLYKQNKIENSVDVKAGDEISKFARDALKNYICLFGEIYFFRRVKEADKDLSDFLTTNINDLDEVK